MSQTDYEWVEDHLISLGYSDDVPENAAIRKTVLHLFNILDAQELPTEEDRQAAIRLFHSLGVDSPKGPRYTEDSGYVWKQFRLGDTPLGSTVRVKKDAYDTEASRRHNGLVGTLAGTRGRRVLVQYIGRSEGLGHQHHELSLEYLAKVRTKK